MTADQIAKLVIQTDAASATEIIKVRCTGAWTAQRIAQLEQQLKDIAWPVATDLEIDSSAISSLDTTGAWLLYRMVGTLEQQGSKVRIIGLRPEFGSLMDLISARAVVSAHLTQDKDGLLASIGKQAWRGLENLSGLLAFVGETAIALLRLIVQPRRIRWRTILYNIQSAGFEALPIVGLLSFLMGVVIAYQGADQLQRFGANLYIADLVGLSMVRELSPLVTAIIIAGRSGSAYAAQIGTMKVTEEIDALRTIGVSPQELLVLPKILALVIALPLLTVYADCDRYNRRHDHGALQIGCQLRRFHCPAWRCGQLVLVSDRHSQSPGICRDHRAGRMFPGIPGWWQCRQCRSADNIERRAGYFSGDIG